jgi:hypothetical protein
MRERLKGIVSDCGAAFERRSDRPELMAPAFQIYFTQGGEADVSPDSECNLQETVDYRFRAALA